MKRQCMMIYLAAPMIALALTMTGCGNLDTETKTTSVGGLLYSERLPGNANFTTAAERGIFITYTSLRAPQATQVFLQQVTDRRTKDVLSRHLNTENNTVLVQSIVTMAE